MQVFFLISLFIFGTLFGSFSSVLIYRLKSGEGGIFGGRSHCPKCNTTLTAIDLVPILSWCSNLGKCRHCSAKVSPLYPILEVTFGLFFALIGIFLIDINQIIAGNFNEILSLAFYLLIVFFTLVFVFYDILYMEIPDSVMAILIFLSFGAISYTSLTGNEIIKGLSLGQNTGNEMLLLAITLGGILAYYFVMLFEIKSDILDRLKDISISLIMVFLAFFIYKNFGIENLVASSFIGMVIAYSFIYLQYELSSGRAMGGGDIRIAMFMGIFLGASYIAPSMIFAYISGSIIGILVIVFNKMCKKGGKNEGGTMIPFGPFLAIGFLMVMFGGEELMAYSKDLINNFSELIYESI